MKRLLMLLAVIVGVVWLWPERALRHPPGVLIKDPPLQSALDPSDKPFQVGEYTLEPLARFELDARVLSAKRYWVGEERHLSPVDLALGWGAMSDQEVVDQLTFSQRGRWYFFRWSGEPPLPVPDITHLSANMHMLPSTPAIEKRLKKVKAGQLVHLKGYLVAISRPDGWRWRSSTSREDQGGGSCEVVWLEEFSARRR